MKWVGTLLLSVLVATACGVGGTDIKHYDIPTLNGKRGQFDLAAYAPGPHLFLAADKTNHGIDVFDASQPDIKFMRTVALGTEPHGMAVVSELGKLFVGNLDGTVAVIDLTPTSGTFLKVLTKINTKAPKGVDLLAYDSRERKLYVSAPDNSTLFVIDPIRSTVLKAINTKKGIEEPVYNPADGMLYVMVRPANSIYKIDPVKDTILSETSIGTACGPYGMAINQKTQQAMISCDTLPVLWDVKHEKLIRTFAEIGSGDQVVYDGASDRFLMPGINVNYVLGIFGGNPVRFYNRVETNSDSKAVAYDPVHRTVFQPNASRTGSGVLAFALPDPEPEQGAVWLPLVYLAGLIAFGALIWYYGRRRAQERRRLGRPMFS